MAEEFMNNSILRPFVAGQKPTSGTGQFLMATSAPNLSCMHGAQVASTQYLLQIHDTF